MVNPMNGFVTHHGTPVGVKHKEAPTMVSEVKTRMMTEEERAALDEQLGAKEKPKKIKEPIHLSPSGKQTKKEKIFSLLRKGASASEIMEKVGASKTSVYLYQKQYRDSMKETDRKKALMKLKTGLTKKAEEKKRRSVRWSRRKRKSQSSRSQKKRMPFIRTTIKANPAEMSSMLPWTLI